MIKLMLAVVALILFCGATAAAADRPNIVFIMTDDHAAHAIGAYGSRVNQTPNLDRLAREGALLENVFATNSICTPSRAAILTGQYSHINGVTVFNRFDSSRMTVARLLQKGGYYTGMIGKWHLGSDPVGFDRWEILPGQGAYNNPLLYTATGEKTYTGRYATDVITDLAIDFVQKRPRNQPFFLMVHHKAPHRPWEPDAAHAAQFASRRIPEPPTLWDSYATRTDAIHENRQRVAADLTRRDLKLPPPADLAGAELTAWLSTKPDTVTIVRDGKSVTLTGEPLTRWKYQRYMQDYLATVQSVDDNVGRLLGALDKEGLAKNTIVVYTSDQGFFLGDHGMFDKRFMYEAVAAHALSRPLASWHQARHEEPRDRVERRLRADVPRCRRNSRAGRHAGPQSSADPAGPTACRLADVDVLPLLPRPGRSRHADALRGPNDDAQADLLLEERSVGTVRSGQRSRRIAQPVRRTGPGSADRHAQDRALSTQERARRHRPARKRPVAQRRRWTSSEATGEMRWRVGLGETGHSVVIANRSDP